MTFILNYKNQKKIKEENAVILKIILFTDFKIGKISLEDAFLTLMSLQIF